MFVKLKEGFKEALRANGCADHVAEFGDCVGVVEGPSEPGWPEVSVRWQPSGLRYDYHPDDLVLLRASV